MIAAPVLDILGMIDGEELFEDGKGYFAMPIVGIAFVFVGFAMGAFEILFKSLSTSKKIYRLIFNSPQINRTPFFRYAYKGIQPQNILAPIFSIISSRSKTRFLILSVYAAFLFILSVAAAGISFWILWIFCKYSGKLLLFVVPYYQPLIEYFLANEILERQEIYAGLLFSNIFSLFFVMPKLNLGRGWRAFYFLTFYSGSFVTLSALGVFRVGAEFGYKNLKYAAQYLRFNAVQSDAMYVGPRTLLLRPFSDEPNLENGMGIVSEDSATLLETLSRTLKDRASVVSFSGPSESEEFHGPHMDIQPNDDWRNAFLERMEVADEIVAIYGKTASLEWELGEIRQARNMQKLILVFPPETPLDHKIQVSQSLIGEPIDKDIYQNFDSGIALIFASRDCPVIVTDVSPSVSSYRLATIIGNNHHSRES